ncbi:AAA family ATPase [Microbacterium sp. 2C]|uniref:AAA family ATPase n=1 Tax=Microbacterium paulum TaxID=2707006 RepID=UPI0018C24264|nr:AAA family ATPase [Microbacterium paulum]MBG0717742.1 AAA family ATPase [Microbacterium paulum]
MNPADASRSAVEAIWDSVGSGPRATVVDSPPGAGKSTLVRELARRQAATGVRVPVAAQTNHQADDLVRGFVADGLAGGLTIGRLHSGTYVMPSDIAGLPGIAGSQRLNDLTGCDIIVATGAKWATVEAPEPWPLVIVDEAYQMRSDAFLHMGRISTRLLLVGDPGQLDPFTSADDRYFRGRPVPSTGNAASTILRTHPNSSQITLPVSWRLDERAAPVISDAFYLRPFEAGQAPGTRALTFPLAAMNRDVQRTVLQAASTGWAFVELEAALMPEVDLEIAETIGDVVRELLARGGTLRDGEAIGTLRASQIAVGVAHNSQKSAVVGQVRRVCAELGLPLDSVVVDTANRLQGREFAVVIVWHPLSGRRDATEFHADAGRLCVLTSRHRHACIVVGRAGIEEQLDTFPDNEDVWLNENVSTVDGIQAQAKFLNHLLRHKVA